MTVFYSNCNHRAGCGVTSIWQPVPVRGRVSVLQSQAIREQRASDQPDWDVNINLNIFLWAGKEKLLLNSKSCPECACLTTLAWSFYFSQNHLCAEGKGKDMKKLLWNLCISFLKSETASFIFWLVYLLVIVKFHFSFYGLELEWWNQTGSASHIPLFWELPVVFMHKTLVPAA